MHDKLDAVRTFRCNVCWARNDQWLPCCPMCLRDGTMHPFGIANSEKKEKSIVSSLGDEPDVKVERILTGIPNLDEVMGGGIAKGHVVQLGGAPGAGKSTLLAAIASNMREDAIYITTEETKAQLARRVRRVANGIYGANGRDIAKRVAAISTIDDHLGIDEVCAVLRVHPAVLWIIDSLQGLRKTEIVKGKVSDVKHTQVVTRDMAMQLIQEAKKRGRTIIMTGHLTKDDTLAGLREIPHMVDVVAWFRTWYRTQIRYLECEKNREGIAGEPVYFTMTAGGLVPRATPTKEEYDHAKKSAKAPVGEDDAESATANDASNDSGENRD